MSRILIAGGGTAGHVVPALDVADVLRADGHDVGFCGAGGIEKRLVPREGYDYRSVRVRGFQRRLGWTTLKTLASLPLAAVDAWRILGDTRPDCVIGVGAYASGPVVAEAAVRGIPSAIVEMDAHLGWSNPDAHPSPRSHWVCLGPPPQQPPARTRKHLPRSHNQGECLRESATHPPRPEEERPAS